LYLPENEIHELGLMYLNYEILLSGYKSIYLGESVPIDNLKVMKDYFDNIVYIMYATVQPTSDVINDYITTFNTEILDQTAQFWIIGRMTEFIDKNKLSPKINTFKSISEIVNEL
jgi:hypothetical protein